MRSSTWAIRSCLDVPRMLVQVDGRDVVLTATEFQLLLHMARQPGRVFTRGNCWMRFTGSRWSLTSVPSTPRSRTFARRSNRIHGRRATCRRSSVWGIASWTVRDEQWAAVEERWGSPPALVAGGRAGPVGRWRELGASRAADRTTHRVLRRFRASDLRQRHLRSRLAAPQRVGAVNSAPFDTAVAVAALVLGGAVVVAAILVLRRLAAPVGALVEGAHRIEAGDLSARVPVRGPSDLRSLARAMNAMSGRLEAEETRRRSVLADIAHELRTPLSIIRGQQRRSVTASIPADAEHLAPIVSATEALRCSSTTWRR